MKKLTAISAAVLLLILTLATPAFATDSSLGNTPLLTSTFTYGGDFSVEKTLPENGAKGLQIANVCVKIVFNKDVSEVKNDINNASKIKISSSDGKAVKFEIKHHPKYTNEIWCLLEEDLAANSEYKVEVSEGITASDGSVLAGAYSSSFNTRNTKTDNTISVILSIGMMVVMVMATTKTAKNAENNAPKPKTASEKVAQADPYRLAREQGISVEEAKAQIAKEKEKLSRKNASEAKAKEKYDKALAEKEAEIARRVQEIHDASVYKVGSRGSLKAHGHKLPKSLEKRFANSKKSKKK